jgi:DNA modification methylase
MAKSKSRAKRETVQREGEPAAVWASIDSVHPWARNPRKVTDARIDRIARSILDFGWGAPIVARRANGEIVAGEGRWRAGKKLGQTSVPIRFIDIDEEKAHKLALIDNRSTELTEWDDDLLREGLKGLSLEETGFLGWSETDLTGLGLLGDAEDEGGGEDPGDVPKNPVSKAGDVWELGRHVLLCDSCEKIGAIAAPGTAVLMVTDPPYGVTYEGSPTKKREKIKNDSLPPEAMRAFWCDAFMATIAVMAPGGAFYCFGPSNPRFMYPLIGSLVDSGYDVKQELVWMKDTFVFGTINLDYHAHHESIFYGWKPGAAHRRLPTRKESTKWEAPRPRRSDAHPTMKPIVLYERAYRNSSKPGELVIDPFGGSGTAVITAERTERICATTEIDLGYCDVIVERWQAETGGKAKRRAA